MGDHEEILSKTFEWWKKVCVIRIGDSTSSKHFLSSLLDTASSAHSSLTSYENVLRDLCADFRNQKSTSDDGSEPKTTYKIISPENVEQLAPTLTKHLDAYYSGMEWLMQQMKGQVSKFVDTNKNADDVFYDQREKVKQREGVICTNVLKVSRGLLELSQTTPSESVFTDSIIKCFTNSFVFYTALSKYFTWKHIQGLLGGCVPSRFEKLVRFIGAELMHPVYQFIVESEKLQNLRLDSKRSKSSKKKDTTQSTRTFTSGKAKVLRQGKGITSLIYAIEQHEHHLILLGKKTKTNLMKSYQVTTSRDFRISTAELQSAMAKQDLDKEYCDMESFGSPDPKRPRMDA